MTQEQAGYLTDALEMMGIVEPKQIVTEVSGFIPVFEVVLHHYKDYMTALVFGRMWQYCGMKDGVCKATIEKLAQDLEMSTATVTRHIELLEEGGYIYDQTPERRNRPHEYVDCGKVVMKGSLSAISQKNVRPSQSNVALSESQLIKQDKTKINKNVSLSTQDLQEVNEKVDYILSQTKDTWQGRELLRDNLLPLADWYNKATNQVMTKRVQKTWYKALQDWYDEGLTPEHLQIAFEAQSKWRMISDPNQLTKDACAIKAAGIRTEAPAEPKIKNGSGYV